MLPEKFLERMQTQLGEEYGAFLATLDRPRAVALRYNPLKGAAPAMEFQREPVPWEPMGHYYDPEARPGLHPFHEAGVYYLQEASAMAPVALLDPQPGERILDLCAAPGGKSTQIAGRMGGEGFLLCNEFSPKRAKILSRNLERLGVANALVTNEDTGNLARKLPGFFHRVLVDAPCSGEGMFRKDEEALSQWSEDNVALCQSRQRRIIADVWPSLAEGGYLIYSTCTFNSLENDDNVKWFSEELGAEIVEIDADFEGLIRTEAGISLIPGFVRGEGQYCALLRKTAGTLPSFPSPSRHQDRWQRLPASSAARVRDFLDEDMELIVKDGRIVAVPPYVNMFLPMTEHLRPLTRGLAMGMFKGNDFVPDADLALSLSLRRGAFSECEVDRETALAFLHRDAVTLPGAERGMLLLVYRGLPIGFVKNLGNRCNSLHPLHRRIRMDI